MVLSNHLKASRKLCSRLLPFSRKWQSYMEPNHHHHHHRPFYYSHLAHEALLHAGHNLKPLQQIHAHLLVTGSHRSLSLLTTLTLSSLSASVPYTHRLLLSIPNPDPFLFTSLITSFSKHSLLNDAVQLYRHILFTLPSLRPSTYVFTAVIKSCAEISALKLGRAVHCHALVRGYMLDSYIDASLVAFYAKCGDLVCARKVFAEMPRRTLVTWNSMVFGYEQNGFLRRLLEGL